MTNELKIYLAGKMSGLTFEEMNNWRAEANRLISKSAAYSKYTVIKTFNPCDYYNFESVKHKSEAEVMDFDLDLALSCDLILVNTDKIETSLGTVTECALAWKNNIPILAFGKEAEHPWLKRMFRRTEDNLEDICKYIQDFYMY